MTKREQLMNQVKAAQLIIFSLALPSLANAMDKQTQVQSLVEDAIVNFQKTELKQWSFQVERYENEEGDITSSLEQFQPLKDGDDNWLLLRKNGKPATPKQQQAFSKKMNKDNKQEKSLNIKLSELINTESLELTHNNATHLQANFPVWIEKLGEDAKGKLQGALTYNKQNQFIEEIRITNTDSFSPVFSASISDLELVLTFIYKQGFVLPHQKILNMKGSFAFFTEIDETSTDTFIYLGYVQ